MNHGELFDVRPKIAEPNMEVTISQAKLGQRFMHYILLEFI